MLRDQLARAELRATTSFMEGQLTMLESIRDELAADFDLLGSREDVSEQEWLRAASASPAFAFLPDPDEDLYTVADGEPLDVQE